VGELEGAGFKGSDGALRRAISRFGRDKAAKWRRMSARDFMNQMMADEIGKGTFGFEEIGAGTEERAEFIFQRCPLEGRWKDMGLSAVE